MKNSFTYLMDGIVNRTIAKQNLFNSLIELILMYCMCHVMHIIFLSTVVL